MNEYMNVLFLFVTVSFFFFLLTIVANFRMVYTTLPCPEVPSWTKYSSQRLVLISLVKALFSSCLPFQSLLRPTFSEILKLKKK